MHILGFMHIILVAIQLILILLNKKIYNYFDIIDAFENLIYKILFTRKINLAKQTIINLLILYSLMHAICKIKLLL